MKRCAMANFGKFLRIAIVLTGMSASLSAQTTLHESLLVLSKHDHTLAIVDPATFDVLARVPVGQDPHEVIASSDGRTAYVSIYGGGAFRTINVIDLVSRKALADIDLGPLNGPHGLDFVGGKLWFTAEGAKAIGSYDPATRKVDWIMGTGQNRTHMIYVTPDSKRIYTTNVASATVSILEEHTAPIYGKPAGANGAISYTAAPFRTDWNQTVISVGKGSEGFDVTPDGRELWTADAQDGTISIVDLAAKEKSATLDAKVFSANRVKFTIDGKFALVSSLNGSELVIYDVAARKEFKRVLIGHGAAGILMQPDGARAFISCGPDNYVAVLDLKTLEVVGHIDAGGEPDGLAWAAQQ